MPIPETLCVCMSWSSYAGHDLYTEKAVFALKHSWFQKAEKKKIFLLFPFYRKEQERDEMFSSKMPRKHMIK